jgi:peptidoglycan L-alanyl-D-glutamate endopeptidase CwlK
LNINERSWQRLAGVHPKLVAVFALAHNVWHEMPQLDTRLDFQVTEGVRSRERQRRLVNAGKSRTMNSKHLDGLAFDFHVIDMDTKEADWTFRYYQDVARVMKGAASTLGVGIEWGGDWTRFRDGPHIQLLAGEE